MRLWARAWKIALAMAVAGALPVAAAPSIAQEQSKIDVAIAAPMSALDRALAEEAQRPPATTDAEQLERLGAIDQSWRLHMGRLRLEGLSADEIRAAYAAIVARTEPIDQRNLEQVMAMLPEEGWFSFSAYGRAAAEAAFHIVNHSDLEFQLRVLPALERMAAAGEADPADFATMYDKARKAQGLPQRYGTQFDCVDLRPVLYRLEDPERVEEFRRQMQFGVTLADHLRGLEQRQVTC
jgi:hypothetical protein